MDEWTPREFWKECVDIVLLAEQDYAEYQKAQADKKPAPTKAESKALGRRR